MLYEPTTLANVARLIGETLQKDYGIDPGPLFEQVKIDTSVFQRPGNDFYKSEERDILNFSVTYANDIWDVQFLVNNMTDELYQEGGGFAVLYGEPRTVAFRVRRDF